jgi:hypothetical protein
LSRHGITLFDGRNQMADASNWLSAKPLMF